MTHDVMFKLETDLQRDSVCIDPDITNKVIAHLYEGDDVEHICKKIKSQPKMKYGFLEKTVLEF